MTLVQYRVTSFLTNPSCELLKSENLLFLASDSNAINLFYFESFLFSFETESCSKSNANILLTYILLLYLIFVCRYIIIIFIGTLKYLYMLIKIL